MTAPESGLSTNLGTVKSIDYVNQFDQGLGALVDLLGITNVIELAEGSQVKTYAGTVTLAGGAVDPGDVIPLSEVEYEVAETYNLAADKRRKAVAAEDIMKYGYDAAINRTDKLLLQEEYGVIRGKFYSQLATGTGAVNGKNLQATMAKAYAAVNIAFEGVDTAAVAIVHPNDVADYLADHQITLENEKGTQYLKNFLGFETVIVTSGIPQNTVYATAKENLVLAYGAINGAITAAFPAMQTNPELPMIGVLHDVQHIRLTAETVTLSAIILFAEKLNGVIVGTIAESELVADTFTGDGSTKAFTLSAEPAGNVVATVDGAIVTAFTVSGQTITFTTAPANTKPIVVTYSVIVEEV